MISYQASILGSLLNGNLLENGMPILSYGLSNNTGNYIFNGKFSSTGIKSIQLSVSSIYDSYNMVMF